MSLNKSVLCLALSLAAFSQCSMAKDGTINFTGSIVESPCVVSRDTQYQDVNLGEVQSSTFVQAKIPQHLKTSILIWKSATQQH